MTGDFALGIAAGLILAFILATCALILLQMHQDTRAEEHKAERARRRFTGTPDQ